jgi:hypothetical protein
MAQRAKGKKRPLRPPFLITVATLAGALGPACGGAVSTDGSGNPGGSAGSDPGTTSTTTSAGGATGVTTGQSTSVTTGVTTGTTGTGGGAAGGGPNVMCPAVMPVGGSSCATSGLSCAYPYCFPGNTVTYTCVGGRWQSPPISTCNPPPPLPCPATEPVVGATCFDSTPNTLETCAYGDVCCGVWRETRDYQCDHGAWRRVPLSDHDAGSVDGSVCPCPDAATPPGDVVWINEREDIEAGHE